MSNNVGLSSAFLQIKTAVFSVVQERKIKILELLVLSIIPLMYLYFVYQDFSALPMPSDPTTYLVPATTPGMPLRFIDRIMVYIGLRISDIFFSPAYVAGMYYIAIVNLLIITICIFWVYCKKGILAGLFAGVLLISAHEFLRLATYIYADQTLALYALIAFIFFYSDYKNKVFDSAVIAGIFTAFTCFSKIPGIALFIPFIITIILERDWSKLKKLLTGFVIGTFLVFLVAFILFGWAALKSVFSVAINYGAQFFDAEGTIESYGDDWVYNRPVSYFVLLVREYYLPIFFSMIILIGAYRDRITRNLYFAAMSFIGILALFVVFHKAVIVSANYIYPTIIFCSLGLALYLANIIEKRKDPLIHKPDCLFTEKARIIYAVICIVFVFISLKIGIMHPSAFTNPVAKTTPLIIGMVYPLIPLIIVGALMAIEYWQSRVLVLLLVILISVWSPAYNGASAYGIVSTVRNRVECYYTAAPLLNQVPADKFSIYVEAWIKDQYSDRLLRIYSYFFNERKINTKNIVFITDPKLLTVDNIKGKLILTDNPKLIRRYFPEAKPGKSILWKNTTLTVMQLP